MSKLTESAIEDLAIKLFEHLGYSHIHAPDISPDGDHPERTRYDEALLTGRLDKALHRINNQCTICSILSGCICKLLHRLDGIFLQYFLPG